MTKKRFRTGKGIFEEGYPSETIIDTKTGKTYYKGYANYKSAKEMCELLNKLIDENEQLKKGMLEVVDRYIRNVEHNPPSSARIYIKIKGALVNIREDLRDLLEDLND